MDRERPIERFLPLRPVEFDVLLSLAAGERHGTGSSWTPRRVA
jgi:hypothetical protein